ncbi:hypothetical protein [Dactylosporangium salmoneum]|uniref:Uncharacterized protein n=1 Tax=Dactylosporangium salmoneum TaxID=53361 RepID=A0ABN3GUQ8_9ACTN
MTEPNPPSFLDGLDGGSGMPEPPPQEFSRRTIALMAGGGLAVVAVAGLLFAALSTGGDDPPNRPAVIGATPAPVVPVGPDAAASSAAPSATLPTSAARPSASRTSARPSASAPTPTGPPRVVSVTVSADPASFSNCLGVLTTKITVRMELSGPGASVRYTINDAMTVRRTATGTSFSETTQILVAPTPGEHRVRVAVSQPSAAGAETTVRVSC